MKAVGLLEILTCADKVYGVIGKLPLKLKFLFIDINPLFLDG